MNIKSRKVDHIKICLNRDVRFCKKNGFEKYELRHNALVNFDFGDIDIKTKFLSRKINAPIIISSITGGCSEAERINKNLAEVAQKIGVVMSCGSQKAMIEDELLAKSYQVNDVAPDIFYIGNIGLDYLKDKNNFNKIKSAVRDIKADGIFVHLNLAQELVQKEGERNFFGSIKSLKEFVEFMNVPVLIKEVGFGISSKVAIEAQNAGVVAIDVAGAGGVSWTKVEKYRQEDSFLAEKFSEWGISTANSLVQCRKAVNIPIIASGGIYDGILACKAIALGADLVGLAGPLLKEANKSSEAVEKYLKNFILELKTAMMLIGVRSLEELKNNQEVIRLVNS